MIVTDKSDAQLYEAIQQKLIKLGVVTAQRTVVVGVGVPKIYGRTVHRIIVDDVDDAAKHIDPPMQPITYGPKKKGKRGKERKW